MFAWKFRKLKVHYLLRNYFLQTALLQPRYVLALIISRICTFKPPPWSVSQTFVLCHTWNVIQIFKNSNKQISIISTLTGGKKKKKGSQQPKKICYLVSTQFLPLSFSKKRRVKSKYWQPTEIFEETVWFQL